MFDQMLMLSIMMSFITVDTSIKDSDCLAKNIYFESRDQSYIGQMAVAEVTMNRVRSDDFPDSVCDVVYQPYAFSWTLNADKMINDDNYPIIKNDIDKQAWSLAKTISLFYLNGARTDITHDSLYYHNNDVLPYWSDCFVKTVVIEDHIFYSNSLQLSPCHR